MKNFRQTFSILTLILSFGLNFQLVSQTVTYSPAPVSGVITICHGGVLSVTVNGTVSGDIWRLNLDPPYGFEDIVATGTTLNFTPVSYTDLGSYSVVVQHLSPPFVNIPVRTINIVSDPTAPIINLSQAEGTVCAGPNLFATFGTAGSDSNPNVPGTDSYEFSIDGGTTWSSYTLGTPISSTQYMIPSVKIKAIRSNNLGCYAENVYTWDIDSKVHDVTGTQGSYCTIQQAIDAANTEAGDELIVEAGTYMEEINLNKAISIKGANQGISAGAVPGSRGAESIINGGLIVSAAATLNGLQIINGRTSGGFKVGVAVATSGVNVTNCIIEDVLSMPQSDGLSTQTGNNNLTLTNSKIANNWRGIYLNPGSGHIITGNLIDANNGVGVGIGSDGQSSLTLTGNVISNHTLEGWGASTVGTGVVATGNQFSANGISIAHYGGSPIIASCSDFGSNNYSDLYGDVTGAVVFVPYNESPANSCSGTNALPTALALTYTAASESILVQLNVTANELELQPSSGPQDLPSLTALYNSLAVALAGGNPATIQSAALAVGDDIITEYYYYTDELNMTGKTYLKTAGDNDLIKNKYWQEYLVRNDNVRFPKWTSTVQTTVTEDTYRTSTNPVTGAVAAGWLNPVLGRNLHVKVTFVHNGSVTSVDESIAIGAGPIKNLTTGLGYQTIQAAINASLDGQTIEVDNGTYVGNLEITKDITLISKNLHGAVIQTLSGFDAGDGYGGITFLADGATLDGFRVEQGVVQAIIHTHNSNNVSILNNHIIGTANAPRGIDVGYASANSNDVLIQGNTFEDLYCGVYVNQATALNIDGNVFNADMGDGGVVFDGTWPYSNVMINNNSANDADYLIFIFGSSGSITYANNTPLVNTELINAGVRNVNKNIPYVQMQAAIDEATSGDQIAIRSGVYAGNVDASAKNISLSPGNSPGCVTINGNYTLGIMNTLNMEANGTTACTEYDQFTVNGVVTLNGAALNLILGYTPVNGDQITLILNDGVDEVVGQFAEGLSVDVGGNLFQINYAGGDGNDVVLTKCGGGVVNTNTLKVFCTIQDAINDATTLVGHTITVAAGIYKENIIVNKSLTLHGPNYLISPNAGIRVGEAIIVPSSSNPTGGNVVSITSPNVNISGFTIDGDNMEIGVAKDALRGIFADANGLTGVNVEKNIVKNLEGSGIRFQQTTNFFATTGGATYSYNNTINDNKIQDITSLGVDLRNSMYAKITNNTISNIRYGIFFSSFRINDLGNNADRVISGNTIQTTQYGIWPNLFSARPYEVVDNAITAVADPLRTKWYGIMMATVSGAQNFTSQLNLPIVSPKENWTFTNNDIDASGVSPGTQTFGYWLWSVDNFRDNANIDHYTIISGGSVSHIDNGLFIHNRDVDPVTSFGVASLGAHVSISNLNISLNSGGKGIYVKDDVAWTASNPAPLVNKRNVDLTLGSGVTITGGDNGLVIEQPFATITSNNLNNLAFTGLSGNYIELINNANNLDGTAVFYDGEIGTTATDAENFNIEDKIFHKIDGKDLGFVTVKPSNAFVTNSSAPTATNNDYTRIKNAVELAGNNWTINHRGLFDWTETNAAASWALGNDGVVSAIDDYSILVPANLNGITFTSPEGLGTATIQGPGDLPAANLEGVLVFDGGDNQNWTISNMVFDNFDLSIGMFFGAGGTDAFSGTVINNNIFNIATDLNTVLAPADVNQNIGLHYSFGANQTISNNTFNIPGNGISNGTNYSTTAAMQSNTSGGAYNNLLITGNTINVLNAQSASPEVILGYWENGHDHAGNITVSNNKFLNLSPSNDPSLNLQRAFRITSHSGPSSTVTYSGNSANGANIGLQWLAGQNFAGKLPIQFIGNNVDDNNTGLHVQSNGSVNALNNFISNGNTGILIDGASTVTATDNDLSNNASKAINNNGSVTANATCNWFGETAEVDIINLLVGNIDFAPWRIGGTDDGNLNNGFQPQDDCLGTPVEITNFTSTPNQFCQNDGTITIDFIGGAGPYTISWTGTTTGSPMAYISGNILGGFPEGSYVVQVTDMNGSTASSAISIIAQPVRNLTGPTYFTTIQEAVNAALSGDVIEVCAGNYAEVINVNKDLTINGPNVGVAGTAVRNPEAVIVDGKLNILGNHTVTFDGFKFAHVSNSTPVSLGGGAVATIQNNIIERNAAAAVSGGPASARGIEISNGIGMKTIKNNKFTGDVSAGVFSGTLSWNNGMYVNGPTSLINIENNLFENCRTSLNIDDMGSGIAMEGNTFDNNGTHISFGGTVATTGSFTLGANDFKTTQSAIINLSNVTTTFRLDITAGSWLGTSFGALPNATLFAIEAGMYHRGRSSRNGLVTYKANNQYVISINPSIQSAVTYAPIGGGINLDAATFNQSVNITKSLTLQGGTSDKSLHKLSGTGLGTTSGIVIANGVTDVTIQNLTVENFTGASGNSHAGIYGIGGNNNTTITNVALLNNPTASGFYANGPVNNVSITNSMVTNNGGSARGIVIWNGLKTNINISNNTVTNNTCCGIELQDGDASAVTISNNTIDIGNGDNGIGLAGLNPSVGANLINMNTITGGGRFGIEIKNPAGGVTVSNNSVSLTTINADLRDRAGIAVFRRGVLENNVDIPNGVTISSNTVNGYVQTLPEEGFGIVIEGTNHTVSGNNVNNCNIGIQQQGGGHTNAYYPNLGGPDGVGNGAQGVGLSPNYFGRGNSPFACGNVIDNTNLFSGNSTDTRNVISANNFGLVTNANNGETFCNIQAAINDVQTLDGHTLNVSAGTFNENVILTKDLTINGVGPTTILTPTVACTGTGMTISANNATVQNLKVTNFNNGLAVSSAGVLIENVESVSNCNTGLELSNGTTNLSVQNSKLNNNISTGFRKGTAATVSGFTLNNTEVKGNNQGCFIAKNIGAGGTFDNINITNSDFSNNTQKGMYFEALNNAVIDGITMDASGIDPAYNNNAGIDINLKYGTYTNVTIQNSDITNSGLYGTATDIEQTAAVMIKARDDASSYNSNPASLSSVLVKNNRIAGPQNGIRLGEFGKINAGPSNVTLEGNNLAGPYGHKAVINRTNSDANLICNWHGTTDIITILSTFVEAGTGGILYNTFLANGGDGNPSIGFQPSASCTCPSGNLVTNDDTNETFCTIQEAIDDAETLSGHTLTVGAGTYVENVVVHKSLTINGPNSAISPNTGTRVGEAVVYPATSQSDAIFLIEANNVAIKGFIINGDNPSINTGWTGTNAADIDAFDGIGMYDPANVISVSGSQIENNIIENLVYFGVDNFGWYNYNNPATTGHIIKDNLFRNLGTYGTGSGYDFWGGGILLYNDNYTSIVDNVMTNVRIGIQTGNFHKANPGGNALFQQINNNTIQARRMGVFYNLHTGPSAAPLTFDGNNITALANANETRWRGFVFSSLSDAIGTASGNIIDGSGITIPSVGYEIWNVKENAPAEINGGQISNVDTGVFVNNFEGYSSDAGNGAHVTITGPMIITPNVAGIGVRLLDSPSSTTHAKVNATVTGVTINGGAEGIKLEQTTAVGAAVGGSFNGNTIIADAAGINVTRASLSNTNALTISDNNIAIINQVVSSLPTVGINLSNITGDVTATIANNDVDGPYYGNLIYHLNTSPVTTITGGTITDIMQGVSAFNSVDGNVTFAPSVFNLSGQTMSGFTGNHGLANINFHAGVYVYTGGVVGANSITANISDVSVNGTGRIAQDCAGLSFADFSTGSGTMQNIKVRRNTLTENLNRGINIRGNNSLIDISTSTLDRNGRHGFNTSNIGFGMLARQGAVVTIDSSFIINPELVTDPLINVSAIGSDPGSAGSVSVTATHNSIIQNTNATSILVSNSAGGTVNATCNWWGTDACPADLTTGVVSVYPYITNGTDNDVATGFQPVPNYCSEPAIKSTVTSPVGPYNVMMTSGNSYSHTICSGQLVTTSPVSVVNVEADNCSSLRVKTVYTTTISTLPPTQTFDQAYSDASILPPTSITPENHDGVAKDIVFVSTPYYDVNGNNQYDIGTDVAGGDITFTLTVQPTPKINFTVTADGTQISMQSGIMGISASYTATICSGELISSTAAFSSSIDPGACGPLMIQTSYTTTIGNVFPQNYTAYGPYLGNMAPAPITPQNLDAVPKDIVFTTTPYYEVDGTPGLTAGDVIGDYPVIFTVTVQPAPRITCPPNVTVSNGVGVCNAVVMYNSPTFTDFCVTSTINQTEGLTSGSVFPVGVTINTWQITDGATPANTAICSFTVTVIDNEPPTNTIPAMGASIAGYTCGGSVSRYTDLASCNSFQTIIKPVWVDNCGITSTSAIATNGVILTDLGAFVSGTFPKGNTIVTFTATDAQGNISTCSVTIEVSDNIAPVFSSLPISFSVAAPPGDCSLIINWVPPVANDNCPGTVSVTSNFSPGTAFDVPNALQAPFEYTITYTATDQDGNAATYSFNITVTGSCIPAVDLSVQAPNFALDPNPLDGFTLLTPKDGVITIKNDGVNASHELAPLGNVKVLVSVPSTSAFTTIGELSPENDDWIVTEYPSSPAGVKMYLFTLKPTLTIAPAASKTIRIRITPVGYIGQKGIISAQLYNGSGGDISPSNNYTQGSFQIAN